MKTINVTQGSPEWRSLRAQHHTASEAPAMMGRSKYQSRSALLEQKATAITPEVSAAQQAIFNKGHAAEAAARVIAEEIIGDELFPATALDDDEKLLASFDGITMLEDVIWEHKLINEELRTATMETLDEHYKIQMDQQLLVSGAEKCLFMASDGTQANCNWFWYTSTQVRLAAIRAGWNQFDVDLASHQPRDIAENPVAETPKDLPAVSIQVAGSLIVTENFDRFESALQHFVNEMLIRDPQTDQDFADLEAQVKALKKAESALEQAEAQLLAQVEAVDNAKRRKDMLHQLARDNRLMAEKLVKEQKKAIKLQIAQDGRQAVDTHIAKLNEGLSGATLPQIITDFNSAMKGKRTIATLRDAADNEVARAKIEATETAALIRSNLETLTEVGCDFLFADRQQLVLKQPEDLQAVIKNRITEHEAQERTRLEEERRRIFHEEQAKAQAKPEEANQVALNCPEQSTTARHPSVAITETSNSDSANHGPFALKHERPTDKEIIGIVAQHYRAPESEVIEWLLGMDLQRTGDALASNF
ncbi:YqaJ viral recombinase family protein [Microbulbifer sp. TYP-18]|uniref:YqaJ viral recombinase family protein n=1 Tax=Microbulbifer sp. TYP-18 TaxID=3230024 RepID=UPI0034C64B7F